MLYAARIVVVRVNTVLPWALFVIRHNPIYDHKRREVEAIKERQKGTEFKRQSKRDGKIEREVNRD